MRIYDGRLLKYVTRKTYKDIFDETYTLDREDWELEAERYGAKETNHDHNLTMPNGDWIENDEREWNKYKRNRYMKFPYTTTDGTICYNMEEYERWNRGYYGS